MVGSSLCTNGTSIGVCAPWSFTISLVLLFIIDRIPGCRIRVTEQEELEGPDEIYLEDSPITGYYCYHENEDTITYGVNGSSTGSAVGTVPQEKLN